MEKFESKIEPLKTIRCGISDKTPEELKNEGWEEFFSFHGRISEQWNMACDRVESAQKIGDWEVVLVNGQSELEKKDGVQYLFRRKTEQRKQWDKEHGY